MRDASSPTSRSPRDVRYFIRARTTARRMVKPRIIIAISLGASRVERRAVREPPKSRCPRGYLNSSHCRGIGAVLPFSEPSGT